MANIAAGTGSVTHAGQGTLSMDKNGRISRMMSNGNTYYADPGDEKYDALYNEYTSQMTSNTTARNQLMADLMQTPAYSYSGTAPKFNDRYAGRIENKLGDILNRESFSYDPTQDENYAAYRKAYLREGDRAYKENLGTVAAMSGGAPSSYAVTAASQNRDYYTSQLTDKLPELYQAAYNRYVNEYNMNQSDLDALRGLRSDDLNKYQIDLNQFNADRNFDLSTYQTNYDVNSNNLQLLSGLVSQDRTFNAEEAARAYEQQYNNALLAAQYGDLSGLKGLGIDTTAYEQQLAAEATAAAGGYGSRSGSGGSGGYYYDDDGYYYSPSDDSGDDGKYSKTANAGRAKTNTTTKDGTPIISVTDRGQMGLFEKQIDKAAKNNDTAQYAMILEVMSHSPMSDAAKNQLVRHATEKGLTI